MLKRLGIVGLGGWASSMHLPVCRKLFEEKRAVYCGLCDRDEAKARKAAELLDGRPYADLSAMVKAERPDGLILLVKPDATPVLIESAIEFRLPFLTEKPPAPSVQIHGDLLEKTRELPHVIAYNRRFTPFAAKAREWMAGQPLQSVEAVFSRHRRREPDFTGTAVHGIDTVLFLAGGRLEAARLETVQAGAVRNYFMTAWTREHCRIALSVTPDAASTEEEYSVRSAARLARIVHPQQAPNLGGVRLFEENRMHSDLGPGDCGWTERDLPELSGIRDEHLNFIGLLEGKEPSRATFQDTLNTQIVREAFGKMLTGAARQTREISF
ncbi:MAG: Gfo/Idh/MocA family oxidoreductase [Planctomycetes bacterium]|nr:Gfo/Idh/MocA family oxidoreductase [Planctomycetota bacterium]